MKPIVTVIGLGYVGFPLACAIAASKKYTVYGLIRNLETARKINQKMVNIIATTDPGRCLPKSDYIVICVPTPIFPDYSPDLRPIIESSTLISRYIKKGQSIILESTVSPGISEELILPILEKSGLKGGVDFDLSHCPERINPGDKKWNVYNIPRNIGSLTKKGNKKAAKFYRSFLKAKVFELDAIKEAESTKIVENAFRDLNIAFVNELAKSFDKMDINLVKVLQASANKPFAFLSHSPGCGVGGHCIAVDPYYLIERARTFGFNHALLKMARNINNSMPLYTVELLLKALKDKKISPEKIKIGLLGLSYKQNIPDTRESPSFKVIDLLKRHNLSYETFDPYVLAESSMKDLGELLRRCKAIIVCTAHKEFKSSLTGKFLESYQVAIVIDGRNCLDMGDIKKHQIYYKGIGR
ncbi:nucleotide sugar dehydrogenase [Candidatus Gottesmanbacteria bacterium]|nr:nucleotide sugar dehydrogenase [Candidatus Gottesmanbacteria bacterium]